MAFKAASADPALSGSLHCAAHALANRSEAYRALGDSARADADYREAIRLDPTLAQ